MTTKTIEHHVLSGLIGDVESNCKKLLGDDWELSGVEGTLIIFSREKRTCDTQRTQFKPRPFERS